MDGYEFAQIAYEAYCNQVEWVSPVTGDSLPQWSELPYSVQNGWLAAAEAIEEDTLTTHCRECPGSLR